MDSSPRDSVTTTTNSAISLGRSKTDEANVAFGNKNVSSSTGNMSHFLGRAPKHTSLTSTTSSNDVSPFVVRISSLQDCKSNRSHSSLTIMTDDSSSESGNSRNSSCSKYIRENVKVPLEMLDSMIVHPSGHSVLQLSAKHRVMLVFIKWFGCPLCQSVVDELQKYLSSFLLLNIVPVACHQEDPDKFSKYIAHTQIMHCSVTNEMKKGFMVQRASLLRHAMMMPTLFAYMAKHKKKFFLPSRKEMKQMDMLSSFGMYMVFKGEVCNSFSSEKLNERPDYGSYIFQLEEEELLFKEQTPEEFIPDMLKLFPTMKEILRKVRVERTMNVPNLNIENIATNNNVDTDQITLKMVLENASMRRFFKAFLANSLCLESLIFYEQVTLYKILCDQEQYFVNSHCKLTNQSNTASRGAVSILSDIENYMELKRRTEQKAKYIIETFLEDQSMFLINTSKKIISRVKTTIEDCGYTEALFDEIVKDLVQNVLKHNFEEFVTSKIFEDMKTRLRNK
ncbi:hypothetical protein FDP41_001481 [Naegleria fowleri]|uniref:RGS domain-containing protein n=1 Tax=Naegleria fowleri TaxID=5763 RepID=A0A6A5BDC3_NAEFO|nr:uncharacterized protein FDP41_009111 [Naegleria fowleri]XP_044564216.1 uncharacterized protein FDP41_001481 [Naegleria fowleri]KAF0972862.1 hypothetical protein FDP41_009111 [Naegleria fowleri]KAF0979503.1 hypothetical protein FDP41_001481 [Naegleria fowleri]CAG4710163.1 unnamed protein product [Naegleria fowleri]